MRNWYVFSHLRAGIALIELYIGRHAYALLKARWTFTNNIVLNTLYRGMIHNRRGRCRGRILVSPYANIKHLLACLQIVDNTVISNTFIYCDVAILAFIVNATKWQSGRWLREWLSDSSNRSTAINPTNSSSPSMYCIIPSILVLTPFARLTNILFTHTESATKQIITIFFTISSIREIETQIEESGYKNGKRKNAPARAEHTAGTRGGKLKTTLRRKEDSDWMHDPGGKNRFSKLSDVERTAAALSARSSKRSVLSFFSFSLSHPFLTRADNGELRKEGYSSHPWCRERIYRCGEFVRFIYREIFSVPTDIRTEKRPEVISRLLRDELRRRFVRDWNPSDKGFSPAFSSGRSRSSVARSLETFPRLDFQTENVVLGIRVPTLRPPSSSQLHFCTSIVMVFIVRRTDESAERRNSNELPNRKLAWSANRSYSPLNRLILENPNYFFLLPFL